MPSLLSHLSRARVLQLNISSETHKPRDLVLEPAACWRPFSQQKRRDLHHGRAGLEMGKRNPACVVLELLMQGRQRGSPSTRTIRITALNCVAEPICCATCKRGKVTRSATWCKLASCTDERWNAKAGCVQAADRIKDGMERCEC